MLSTVLLMATSMVMAQPVVPNVPKEVLESMDYYVGRWKGEGTEAGTKYQFTARWAPGKHCTIFNARIRTPDGVVQSTLISGWDAREEQVVDFSYGSDGSHSAERWTLASPTVEEAISTGVSASGKRTKANFRIEKRGSDEFVLRITDRVEGDARKPDIAIEYTRIKQAEKPE